MAICCCFHWIAIANCKLQLFQNYLCMQEHSVNEWETCIDATPIFYVEIGKRGLRLQKATYTTTQYNNWDKIKLDKWTCNVVYFCDSVETTQLDSAHDRRILSSINSPINFKLFKQMKYCVWCACMRTKSYYERETYCDCNYKASAIMVASKLNCSYCL